MKNLKLLQSLNSSGRIELPGEKEEEEICTCEVVMFKYNYLTNCVCAKAEDLDPMIDDALEITYNTFMKHIDAKEIKELFPSYDHDARIGLTLKNDWHVRYYRSEYKRIKCYYIVHSAIEYIFVRS